MTFGIEDRMTIRTIFPGALRRILQDAMRRFPLAGLLIVAATAGCDSLRNSESGAVTQAGATAQPTANRPTKFLHRFGPFAVSSDFEIDPADPLFRELEALPDQVRKELKLPT